MKFLRICYVISFIFGNLWDLDEIYLNQIFFDFKMVYLWDRCGYSQQMWLRLYKQSEG